MIVPKSGYLKSQLTRNEGIGICNPSYPEMIIRKSDDRQDILFEAFFEIRYPISGYYRRICSPIFRHPDLALKLVQTYLKQKCVNTIFWSPVRFNT